MRITTLLTVTAKTVPLCALALGLQACSGTEAAKSDGGSDGAVADTSTSKDSGTNPSGQQVGVFKFSLVPPVAATADTPAVAGYTGLLGKVYTGSMPQTLAWDAAAKEGDCTLLTPRSPVCSTPCGDTEACVETDTCQAYPSLIDVGTIKVKGMSCTGAGTEFSIPPVSKIYQIPVEVTCPFPAFAEGDQISVAVPGGSYGALSMQAAGIAPLTILNETITLTPNQPLTLNWTPPVTQPASSTIHVKLDIAHHGGVRGKIECDTADDGSLQLSASMLAKLTALGVAGFPTVVVSRISSNSAAVSAGHVDLSLVSETEQAVVIPGLTSCTGDTDCPSGQICQADKTCS